jgi:hypothetical protein
MVQFKFIPTSALPTSASLATPHADEVPVPFYVVSCSSLYGFTLISWVCVLLTILFGSVVSPEVFVRLCIWPIALGSQMDNSF